MRIYLNMKKHRRTLNTLTLFIGKNVLRICTMESFSIHKKRRNIIKSLIRKITTFIKWSFPRMHLGTKSNHPYWWKCNRMLVIFHSRDLFLKQRHHSTWYICQKRYIQNKDTLELKISLFGRCTKYIQASSLNGYWAFP